MKTPRDILKKAYLEDNSIDEKDRNELIDQALAELEIYRKSKVPKKKTQWDTSERYINGVDKWGVDYAAEDARYCNCYNQAIADFHKER